MIFEGGPICSLPLANKLSPGAITVRRRLGGVAVDVSISCGWLKCWVKSAAHRVEISWQTIRSVYSHFPKITHVNARCSVYWLKNIDIGELCFLPVYKVWLFGTDITA